MDRERLQEALAEYDKICGTAWAEYDKICGTALAECNKIRNAAWAEYDKICDAALSEYDKISDAAWAECVKIRDAALSEYDKICKAARAEYIKICKAAWQNISTSVNDPLVSWIIKECAGYKTEALEVLRVLPASLSELDEYASHAGWCGDWTEFRTKALKAGVIAEN
jgi:hypothetical protein